MSGGGGNRAADEANRQEQARQAAIQNTQSRVNQVFNSPGRAADIADYVGAIRQYHGDELNREKGDADRELRFALARGGQIGGSTQVDQQKLFAQDYSRGLLDVERRAQGAGAELESADQDARARLISLATSGLDATTAAQSAASAMRTNLEAGKAEAMMAGAGKSFTQTKTFADRVRDASEYRRGLADSGFGRYQPSAPTRYWYGGAG